VKQNIRYHIPKLVVIFYDRELMMPLLDIFAGTEQYTDFGCLKHRDVIERVPHSDALEIQILKHLNSLAFLVSQPQHVLLNESIIINLEGMTEYGELAELLEHRLRVRLKSVCENEHSRA
jgi:hypothetical protein